MQQSWYALLRLKENKVEENKGAQIHILSYILTYVPALTFTKQQATGTILERALPTISAREKRGGGGGAKAASSVQIRPIGSKAKEIKAAKKAGGGKGSGKQEGGKGNGRQQGGKGSGKQQGGKGSGKQQGGKGGNGKGSGNFVEKKSGIVHIKTAAQKSKDSKAAHADAPAAAGDSAESGAKPQREKKERRARGTGKKQQDM